MAERIIKLPDIGEGIAEAEISEWEVEVGDWINEDDVIGVVLTDKAAVEIPSSLSGKVLWLAGKPGEMLAVGAPLVKIDVAEETGEEPATDEAPKTEEPKQRLEEVSAAAPVESTPAPKPEAIAETRPRSKSLAAAAVRQRASDLGLDLSTVTGTGPDGRVTHADLDRHIGSGNPTVARAEGVTETPVIGMRRKIAEQMALANARIPQITIVEEIDVTELERTRAEMNAARGTTQPKLTMLPFLLRALLRAREVAPQVNARYDDETGILHEYAGLHAGIATQTERGLVVPVLRHVESRDIWDLANEIARLATAARDGSLGREEFSGSTITVTSLGPLGAIATTPIINHPEVAILGVNRKQIRPLWDGRDFVPREVMNISASFDHRIVDGWDAANFIARLKTLLETPALLFA